MMVLSTFVFADIVQSLVATRGFHLTTNFSAWIVIVSSASFFWQRWRCYFFLATDHAAHQGEYQRWQHDHLHHHRIYGPVLIDFQS